MHFDDFLLYFLYTFYMKIFMGLIKYKMDVVLYLLNARIKEDCYNVIL